MTKVSRHETSTADYRMTGAVGAETTLNTRDIQKIRKSMGDFVIIGE